MTKTLLCAFVLLSIAPVSAQGLPDILGDNLIQIGVNRGFPGDSLTLPVVAANIGTAPAPAFPAAIYFSTDRYLSPDDVFVTRVMLPGVGVQSTGGRNVRIAIPDLPRGGYQVLAALDDPDTVRERDETNNVNSAPFTISPAIGGPDLLVSTASLEDATVAPGGRVTVEYRPANRGQSDVGDFEVAYYLAPINRPPAEWILLERETLGGLDAGEDEDESEQVTVPSTVPPAEYGFIVVLDDQNLIAESVETNNYYGAGRITVTGQTGDEASPGAAALGLRVSPNPSDVAVRLSYSLSAASYVRLAVYDALGREVAVVASGAQGVGAHTATADTSVLPAGVYVARLVTAEGTAAVSLTVAR